MYGIIPKPLWEKKSPPDELNRILLALRLMAIEQDGQKILVDTGVGDYHGAKFDSRFALTGGQDPLEASLQEIGWSRQAVTDLVISHLHFDHAGGMALNPQDPSQPLAPAFPQARLHLHRQHYAYACHPTARDQGSFHQHVFKPLVEWYQQRGQLIFYQGEEGPLDLAGDFFFKCSHGHTPYLMHLYNHEYIYMADLIPTSHHIPLPWVMGYDIYPGRTVQDKEEFLRFILQRDLTMVFEHDPDHALGKVTLDPQKGFVFAPLQT